VSLSLSRRAILLGGLTVLAGCGTQDAFNDPPEAVARAAYRHDGPTALTLYTMVNNKSNAGAHTSLMVSASQRVIFDPAGSVRFKSVPERGDVLFGITPQVAKFYESAHARETFHVVIQHIDVPVATAERALQLVLAKGSVPAAQCTLAITSILSQLPGFQQIGSTWFPQKLRGQMAQIPGVTTRRTFETDSDDKDSAVAQLDAELAAIN